MNENTSMATGMVAQVVAVGFTYAELRSTAQEYFESLFEDVEWEWLGSMMQPYSYSQAFADNEDRPEQWIGTFFAKVVA